MRLVHYNQGWWITIICICSVNRILLVVQGVEKEISTCVMNWDTEILYVQAKFAALQLTKVMRLTL